MKPISPARVAAAKVLHRVQSDPFAQAGNVLSETVRDMNLREDDTRLARAIVFGVLRYAPKLDYYYSKFLKKPPATLVPELRTCLRMAACQLYLLTKIPPYAVVDETVTLGRQVFRLKPPQAGFLNAILRKMVAAEAPPEVPAGNRVSDLSVRYSTPEPFARALVGKFGTHHAVAIMEASLQEPPLTLRVNRLLTTPEALAKDLTGLGFEVKSAALAPDSLEVTKSPENLSLFALPHFERGEFYIQDVGSQLVAHLVAPRAGEKILDMCAAPGGKTTHMAELAGGKAEITATDISADRLRLVHENIQRLHTPGVEVQDISQAMEADRVYDAVLVDAPCSGLGTIRRNPEIKYRVNAEALARQSEKQLEILTDAAAHVGDGGRLVYSTCSFSTEENRFVVEKFLKQNPDWEICRSDCLTKEIAALRGPDGFYRTWPTHPEADGFEAVVLLHSAKGSGPVDQPA